MLKICLNVIEENEEIVRRLTPKEKKKEMIIWNDDDERNVAKLRMRNVRFLNLKNQKKSGENKVNVLEKNGMTEQKESWRMTVENEIEMKENEVEELRKKKKQAKSKKRKMEIFKECEEGMIVNWKETPGKDEEILRERMENVENVVENVISNIDSLTLPICLRKKTEEEEEKTISPNYSVSIAEDQVVQNATITVEGKYCISRKLQKFEFEASKVSGIETKVLLSKPQQVYTSVGIEHQIVTGCTGSSTNGRRVWEAMGPSGQ